MLKSIVSKVAGLAIASVFALGVFVLAPANSAHAQEGPDFQREYTGLELAYERMLLWSTNMGNRLDFADEIVEALDDAIATLDEYGQDSSPLMAARNEFRSDIDAAIAEYDQGAAILAAGNGFDSNNEVTDPDAARATIDDARGHFAEAREISVDALQELQDAWEQVRADIQAQRDQ